MLGNCVSGDPYKGGNNERIWYSQSKLNIADWVISLVYTFAGEAMGRGKAEDPKRGSQEEGGAPIRNPPTNATAQTTDLGPP